MLFRLELFIFQCDLALFFLLVWCLLWFEFISLLSINIILVNELSFIVFEEQLHGPRAVTFILRAGMSRDSDDSDAIQWGEWVVLELLRDSPRDQVPWGTDASLHVFLDRLLRDVSLEADLDRAQDVRERLVSLLEGSHQHEDLMGGCIWKQ